MGTTPLADLLQLPGAAAVAVDLIATAKGRGQFLRELLRSGLQPQHPHTRRDPSRGASLTSRPKSNLARSPGSRHHHSMANSPSAAFLRLRKFIAERIRMSHIYQPLMLMELLGRSSPAPAQDVARRILGSGWWAGCSPVTASPPTATAPTAWSAATN